MSEQPVLEVFDCQQGTQEWFAARLGIPTASMFDAVMARGAKGGASKTRRTYQMKLVGELLTGQLTDNFNNVHMDRGKEMESAARSAYALTADQWVDQIGFLRRGRAGCSPDGLVDGKGMLEIKTKLPHLQLEVLLANELPNEHKAQCQGQLWIAGRQWLDFVSYWPDLPLLIVRVERDEEYIDNLRKEIDTFLAEMDELVVSFEKMGAQKRPARVFSRIDGFDVVPDESSSEVIR
jgi:hypothetical protein